MTLDLTHKAPGSIVDRHLMEADGAAALAGIAAGTGPQQVGPITLGAGLSIVGGALTMGSGGPYVLKTGDTMTGNLTMSGANVIATSGRVVAYAPVDSDAFTAISGSGSGWAATFYNNAATEYLLFAPNETSIIRATSHLALDTAGSTRVTISDAGNATLAAPTSGTTLAINAVAAGVSAEFAHDDGYIRVRDGTDLLDLHIRPNSGKGAYITFTENGVADRWSIGCAAGSGDLLVANGSAGSSATRLILGSTGALYSRGAGAGFFAYDRDATTDYAGLYMSGSTAYLYNSNFGNFLESGTSGTSTFQSGATSNTLSLNSTGSTYLAFNRSGTRKNYIQSTTSGFLLVQEEGLPITMYTYGVESWRLGKYMNGAYGGVESAAANGKPGYIRYQDWYVYYSTATDVNRYVHIKTNQTMNDTMWCIRFEGYAYGVPAAINATLGCYAYSGGSNVISVCTTGSHTCSAYKSSDGYMVLTIYIGYMYYCGFTLTAIQANPSAVGSTPIAATAATHSTSATGVY